MPGRNFNSSEYRFGFNGMESDDELKGTKNSYDFGARIYDPRIGRWLSVDPVVHHETSPYVGIDNSPIYKMDPDGEDGLIIIAPNYPSGGYPLTGHAGVLLIDNKTGFTKYYEYGRYDKDNFGMVRSYQVPNVVIGDDGRPTAESLNNTLNVIAKESFTKNKGTDNEKTYDITGAYFKSDGFEKMKAYAEQKMSEGTTGEKYKTWDNNCGDFASDVVESADDVPNNAINFADWMNAAPSTLIKDLKLIDDFTIYHSTEDGSTEVGNSDKYPKPDESK